MVLVTVAGLAAFAWAFGQTIDAQNQAIRAGRGRDIAKEERENAKRQEAEAKVQEKLARKAETTAKEQRDLADKARTLAEFQKARAEKQLLRAESFLYINQFTEAHNHFQNHDLVQCRLALDDCHWDLRGPEYGYLVKQLEKKARTLVGHTLDVRSLALSGDGKRLFSGSQDSTIQV